MVPHPNTPILNCFYHLLWFYFLTVSKFSCFAKSYSVSGLTPLPHIPNQLHFTQKSAHTYDFSSCFFPKFNKSAKRGFSREMTYFFGLYGPKIGGGGVHLPEFCPKKLKTLKFGLFWGIFACSGLVLQNSAAHQCTCL